MRRRRLAGVAGLAASISVAMLVIAEATSSGLDHPAAAPLLFGVMLASIFTLLAVAVVDADRYVDQLSKAHEDEPRWSLRSASRRVIGGPARAIRRLLTSVLTKVRAGRAWLRRQFDAEQRRTTMTRAKERWYDALVVLGMPPAAREAGTAAAATAADVAPVPPRGITELATNGLTRLRTALAGRRRDSATLPGRRARSERSRPPRSTGPPNVARHRPGGSSASTVDRLPGPGPFV